MKQRVITAVLLIPIVLGALLAPTPWPWGVLVVLATGLCLWEHKRLTSTEDDSKISWILVSDILGLLLFIPLLLDLNESRPSNNIMLFVLAGLGYAGVAGAKWREASSGRPSNAISASSAATTFSLVAGGAALVIGQSLKLGAINAALLAMVPIWAGDTAAIFAGKAFGKHKLAPNISPNKTWEGSIANLLACIGCAFALGMPNQVSALACLLVGLSTGILGQIGDLYESLLKRRAGVKDSGTLLPGHGGMYDRLDSLMMSAAPSVLILIYLR